MSAVASVVLLPWSTSLAAGRCTSSEHRVEGLTNCASIFVICKYMLRKRKNHSFPSPSALSGPPGICMEGRE